MIRSLLVCSLTLVLTATSANAGLDLAWNACNTNGGAVNATFDCAGGTPAVLLGSWQVPVSQDSVVSLDGSIEMATQTNPMPSFWHFESCNQGFDFSHVRPGAGCTSSFNTWSAAGSDEDATFLPPGSPTVPPGGNRGRWIFTVFRPQTSPINVPANRNNFGFSLTFLMDAAVERGGSCAGCTDGVALQWPSAMLGNVRSNSPGPYQIMGSGLTTNCTSINSSPVIICGDPVHNRTWGQIKAFYH